MNFAGIFLILLGIAFIAFPQLLQYILATLFIFMGITSIMAGYIGKKMKSKDQYGEYIKFGDYTIYTKKK